ncbi:hypothetical protein FOA52_006464 [Chlamydomonas sp. UWO 241]|nr:hypothetical protein FOA52_006464 [Chlamydomonas sp. UWO 241]
MLSQQAFARAAELVVGPQQEAWQQQQKELACHPADLVCTSGWPGAWALSHARTPFGPVPYLHLDRVPACALLGRTPLCNSGSSGGGGSGGGAARAEAPHAHTEVHIGARMEGPGALDPPDDCGALEPDADDDPGALNPSAVAAALLRHPSDGSSTATAVHRQDHEQQQQQQHMYDVHVVLHESYRVPALFLRGTRPSGEVLMWTQLLRDFPAWASPVEAGSGAAQWASVAPEVHPLLQQPGWVMLHPCHTATIMALLLGDAGGAGWKLGVEAGWKPAGVPAPTAASEQELVPSIDDLMEEPAAAPGARTRSASERAHVGVRPPTEDVHTPSIDDLVEASAAPPGARTRSASERAHVGMRTTTDEAHAPGTDAVVEASAAPPGARTYTTSERAHVGVHPPAEDAHTHSTDNPVEASAAPLGTRTRSASERAHVGVRTTTDEAHVPSADTVVEASTAPSGDARVIGNTAATSSDTPTPEGGSRPVAAAAAAAAAAAVAADDDPTATAVAAAAVAAAVPGAAAVAVTPQVGVSGSRPHRHEMLLHEGAADAELLAYLRAWLRLVRSAVASTPLPAPHRQLPRGPSANDVAKSFATSVGSKTLKLWQACIIAGIFEFAGAMLLGGSVAKTIVSASPNTALYTDVPEIYMYGMLCALTIAGTW